VGRLLTELPAPDPSATWQDQLRHYALEAREAARRHPAVFPLLFDRPSVTPDAVKVVDMLYQALLDAGIPAEHVPRIERLVSTFVIGFAISEISGRFSEGSRDTRSRRAALPATDLPAHHRLAATLDTPVDWDAEFEADLEDLAAVINAVQRRG
jgi:hypothetical protein